MEVIMEVIMGAKMNIITKSPKKTRRERRVNKSITTSQMANHEQPNKVVVQTTQVDLLRMFD